MRSLLDLPPWLVQLEGLDSAAYRTDSAHLLLKKISIPAVRGDITTSDGTMLAMTVQTYTVFADPVLIPIKSRPAVATKLARLLGLSASAVMTMLDHPSSPQYQVLASEVTVTTASKIRQLQLPGIDMTTTYTTSAAPDAGAWHLMRRFHPQLGGQQPVDARVWRTV